MAENQPSKFNFSIVITLVSLAAVALFAWLSQNYHSTPIHICYLVTQTCVISIVIWQACDPFADAAQFIGVQLRIPGSVRGATLDAVASSMPELFTGIFFVLVAISAVSPVDDELLREASGEGFGATVATCAGSAVYNMILIPALCAVFISFVRKNRPTIDIEDKVISRDGLWFLGCEFVLIFFLFQDRLYWWMAFVMLGMYAAYVWVLYGDARNYQKNMRLIRERIDGGLKPQQAIEELRGQGLKISRDLVERINHQEGEDDAGDEAGILFGMVNIKLSTPRAWLIIAISTLVAAAACYWLVKVTNAIADDFNVPVFFVAIIITAAASSVPDTFLSMGSARRGDDDGAVSNAFGSNIFDITICLSLPLFVGCYLSGWQPIDLTTDGTPDRSIVYLRFLLAAFSIITLLIMWHNRQLTRRKAYVLFGLYAVFVGYAVWGSLG